VPTVAGVEVCSEDLAALSRELPFARGLGRAYGDAALPAPQDYRIAGSVLADRILAFDEDSGCLTAEAGLSLAEITRILLPRGYFTPVSPGTRFVTLGGMVAADVHGKNHHREGTFGRHVQALTLRTGTGDVVTCSPEEHPDLFWATVGGMGLTGVILTVTFRLATSPTAWIWEERQRVRDVDEFMDALKASGPDWPMSAGWIDTLAGGRGLGRGVLIRGRWAEPHEAPAEPPSFRSRGISVPFELPSAALNPWLVRGFNAGHYWYHGRKVSQAIVHPFSFFYPLDVLHNWTRLYGRRGFTQYQCVLPEVNARSAARRVLEVVSARGGTSFLCVIKDCGEEGAGLLSFPMPGISIALDIPYRDHTQALTDALNEVVIAAGGRIYLAKDALTRREHFRAMEPRLERFLAVRRLWDPDGRIRSAQSVRLFGW
jgi:FAD/FMN-containing dehydrogenase